MDTESINQRLHEFYNQTQGYKDSIGYPSNLNLEFLQPLQHFLCLPLNNVGTRTGEEAKNLRLNSVGFEQEVIRFMAGLYGLSDEEACHGYITSGGTEANLYSLARARDDHPDALLYFSASSHYSIPKSAHLLGLPHRIIPVNEAGEMDYAALEIALRQRNTEAVILSLNIGTTMRGAIDRVDTVIGLLEGLGISRFHIHCDAALFGMMLPFMPGSPCPDFGLNIHSLAVSGHKFPGCPFPCGMVITRTRPSAPYIDYIRALDATLLGSRNGHAPIFLWYALMTRGWSGLSREVHECIENARYLENELTRMNYPNHRAAYSNIVCLRPPPDPVIKKWNLAVEASWAHVVVMQHVDRLRLNRFLQDLMPS
jgi:histidine decarboxylase